MEDYIGYISHIALIYKIIYFQKLQLEINMYTYLIDIIF